MLRIRIEKPRMPTIVFGANHLKIAFDGVTVTHSDLDPYTGEYEVTPSRETQILPTAGKSMAREVTVHPIPPNYGLITYNGFEITVS